MNYTIGKFSKLTGVNTATLRYYEQEGLVVPRRDEKNQYRYYDDQNLMEIRRIKTLRGYGFSIESLKEPNEEYISKIRWYDKRINEVTKEIESLANTLKQLELGLMHYKYNGRHLDIVSNIISDPQEVLLYSDCEILEKEEMEELREWEKHDSNASLGFVIKENIWKAHEEAALLEKPLELKAFLRSSPEETENLSDKLKPIFKHYAAQESIRCNIVINKLRQVTLKQLEPLFLFARENAAKIEGDILLLYGGSNYIGEDTSYLFNIYAFLTPS